MGNDAPVSAQDRLDAIRELVSVGFARVLHLGCEDGALSRLILTEGGASTLHGVDASVENVRIARRTCDGLPATFQVLDILAPYRPWSVFDVVIVGDVFLSANDDDAPEIATRFGRHALRSLVLPSRGDKQADEEITRTLAQIGLYWSDAYSDDRLRLMLFSRPAAHPAVE